MQNSLLKFDEQRRETRQLRALATGAGGADFLANRIVGDFCHRINAMNREFNQVDDLFSFFDIVSATLEKQDNIGTVTRHELPGVADAISVSSKSVIKQLNFGETGQSYTSEHRRWPIASDLIVSVLGIPTGAEFQNLMVQLFASLKSDGLLLMAIPASGTLAELRESLAQAELELSGGAASRVDPFVDTMRAGSVLQNAGFSLPVIDREELVIRYDDVYALVGDIRAMGMTYAYRHQNRVPFIRKLFERADAIYRERLSDEDGRILASFNYLNLTAWAPHENQQKPLRPGSAIKSLADGLRESN